MRRTVMVVDDSQTVRQAVSLVLSGAGFDVIEGVDGIDAMEKLRQKPDVALIFCDVNMPRMSGIEMLESMRQDPAVAGTPVVMLTSEGQASLVARAKDSGAKGWIVKPFKPEFLLAAVKKLARAS
jgi:two-component system, chemotaxis family, chemotaxis protein CheY